MSSPGLSVNDVLQWLERVRGLTLPTLPFSGVWQRLTALWQKLITSALPSPRSPLPWTIDVGGAWDNVIPGTHVSIESIQIVVSEPGSPVSPPASPPRARSATRVRTAGRSSVRATPRGRAGQRRRRRPN